MNSIKLTNLLINQDNKRRLTKYISRSSCRKKPIGKHGLKALVLRNLVLCLTVVPLAALAALANAQAEHVTQAGPYTLRASALKSEFIPNPVAREHNIDRAPDRGILNVVVLRNTPEGKSITIPAAVIAYQKNLIGQRKTIEMRSVKQNDRLSYLGTFEFDPSSNLHFTIEAKPQGSDENIVLEFKDQL